MGGSAGRRRLSSGRAALAPLEVNNVSSAREKTEARPSAARASSEVAQMYQTAIKMASENKITSKNAWTLSLIDHMLEVVEDDDQLVNFQRASCTLEAGVKIYCGRVDETFETTHKVLESLARRKPQSEEEEEKATIDEVSTVPTKKSKPISTLVAQGDSSAKIDRTATDDVVFKPLALADATAAKDMVLQRLACQAPAAVALDYREDTRHTNNHYTSSWRIDLPALPPAVSPTLSALRAELAIAFGDDREIPPPSPQEDFPAETIHLEPPIVDNDIAMGEEEDDVVPIEEEAFSQVDTGHDDDDTPVSRDFDDMPESSSTPVEEQPYEDPLQDAFAPAENGLDYFSPVEYIGFQHWQLPPPTQATTTENIQVKPKKKAVVNKAGAAETKAQRFALFDGPPPAKSVLAPAKNLRKRADAKRPLTLPFATRPSLTTRDLSALFLSPGWCVKPLEDSNHEFSQSQANHFEAHVEPPLEPHFEESSFDSIGIDEDADDRMPFDNLNDEENFQSSDFGPTFLTCDRRVEIEHVSYAKTAKRVDVRRLKSDLWSRISHQTEPLPFSTAVADVAHSAHYDTNHVTMPFFFTCLLHLCNDHNLALSAIPDAADQSLPPLSNFLIHHPAVSAQEQQFPLNNLASNI